MLDIGFSEILLIFVLGLIVLGPQKLPRVAAQVGRWIGRARAMARQFREQLEEEINVEETKKKKPASSTTAGEDAQGSATGGSGTPGGGSTGAAVAGGAAADAEVPGAGASTPGTDTPGTGVPGEGAGSSSSGTTSAPAEAPHLDLTNEPWPYVTPVPPPEVTDIFNDVLRTPIPGAATAAPETQAGASEGAAASGASRAAPPAPSAQVHWPHDHEVSEAAPEHVSSEDPVSTHERGP